MLNLERKIIILEGDIQYLVGKLALLQIVNQLRDGEKKYLSNKIAGKSRRYMLLANGRYIEPQSRESW